MNFVIPNFAPAAPEIVALTLTCVVLVVDLFLKPNERFYTWLLSQLTVLVTLLAVFWAAANQTDHDPYRNRSDCLEGQIRLPCVLQRLER